MAYTGKDFLDYNGLSTYDSLLKDYINIEDAKSIKDAKLDTSGDNLLLYKDKTANASSSEVAGATGGPSFIIPLGSATLSSLITKLANAAGVYYDTTEEVYVASFTGDYADRTTIVGAINAISTALGVKANLTTTDKTTFVAAINELVTKINNLDATEFPLATENNNVVTIHGIKEVDGVISAGTDSANNIVLEEVAYTGAASDVATSAITDGAAEPQTLYSAGTVQGTLQTIARDLNNLESSSVITVEKQVTAESGYAATYVIKQNNAQVGTKINIPLDYLVKEASVKAVTAADVADSEYPIYAGAEVGDKYIDFVVNAVNNNGIESHMYIPVDDLMSAISGGITTVNNQYELQISISATNQITATLNNIYAQKIIYIPTSNTTIFANVDTVQEALDAIDTKIQGMDADIDASTATVADTYGVSPLEVVTGIEETDGTITAVDSGDADPFGAATAVYSAIGSISDAQIESLFSE